MSSPKATLGYRSRTEAIQGLRAQNLTTRQIAARIGIETKTVAALEASALRRKEVGGKSTDRQHTVCIDNDVLRALRPHAARRGLSVNQLVRLIIAAVADDDIVDAVLGDQGEAA